MSTGYTLTGELSYQGKDFYKNIITTKKKTENNLTSIPLFNENPAYLLDTSDLLDIQIETERQLEKMNVLNNLVAAIDYKREYQWGTSINPCDIHRNKKYFTGAYYDKDLVKIDFRKDDSKRDYENKSLVLHSYSIENDILEAFGLSPSHKQNSVMTVPLVDDSDTFVSKENPKVKKEVQSPVYASSISSSAQVSDVVYNKSSRPTLQMFYQPNEYYSRETGFKFTTEDGGNSPFFNNWSEFTRDIRTEPLFSSIIPEFRISERIDDYESREGKYQEKIKNFLSLQGAGSSQETTATDSSSMVSISTKRTFSQDGTGLQSIILYPEADNNYAWYSSRNRELMLSENKDYRGQNLTYIPTGSTFSIENSVNTEYKIERSNGYNGMNNSAASASWYTVDPVIKKNAAAKFNVDDNKNDYLVSRITKFGTDNFIDLTDDAESKFSLSLWFAPDEDWFESETEVGLLSLTNGLEDHRKYLSIFCKNANGKISISSDAGTTTQTYDSTTSCSLGKINNLILTHDSGALKIYLNGTDVTPGIPTFSSLDAMFHINNLVLGISYSDNNIKKYRGIIDEVFLFKGVLTASDINKVFSGGIPTNVMEMYVNQGFAASTTPVLYNRVGYPSTTSVSKCEEFHDSPFFDRYVLGSTTNISMVENFESIKRMSLVLTGAKKVLPYNGLYPYQRILQMGELFDKTYRTPTAMLSHPGLSYSQKIQSLYQPFFAPGVLFNSLRAGIECPWPVYTNATGLEPTYPYDEIETYTEVSNGLISVNKIYDNLAPSWYYDEKYRCENREFLKERPETYDDIKKTRSWKELEKSQPKFLNNLNDECGLVLNRVANSKLSLKSLQDNSFYENVKKMEQETLESVETYQYCVLEFVPSQIEANAGFSLYSTGQRDNINITFLEAKNLEKTGKKYSINKNPGMNDSQIEIESYEFTPQNIEKSVCELLNLHMPSGEYRAIPMDRANESIPKPEKEVLEQLDLKDIDKRLDTSGADRVRIAFVYIGQLLDPTDTSVSNRNFLNYREARVSTFAGDDSERLGIKYRDKNNARERNVDLTKIPLGQYDKDLYSGITRVVSITSSQPIDSKGVKRREEQIYLLAGDHYSGTALDLSEEQVWPNFKWSPTSPDTRFQKAVTNFMNETQDFFLKHKQTLRYQSSNKTINTIPGKTYSMEVYLRKTDNFSTIKTKKSNTGKYSGPPYRFQAASLYRREEEITDDLAFAPFVPAYHYGEVVAKISFTATEKSTTIKEMITALKIEHINSDMEKEYSRRFPHTGEKGLESFLASPSYRGKNNVDSCVDLMNITDDGDWQIALKSEFPMLNYNDSVPTLTTPVGFCNNLGKLPAANEGVYFGVRESINQAPGANEGSLIELCQFYDPQNSKVISLKSENRIGEFADKKVVREALMIIPYCKTKHVKVEDPYARTENIFTINRESGDEELYFFTKKRSEYLDLLSSSDEDNSFVKATSRLNKYIIPPELDFINNTGISPYACYVLESSIELSSKDLANIWQGRLSDKSLTWSPTEEAENDFEHALSKSDFFGGKKIPQDTRFMVLKLKQKSEKYANNEGSYNWPYDYFSVLEKAKVDFKTTTEEVEV